MLRHLEGINPFPEVNQIDISCFHWILHHCKIPGFFTSTRMAIGNFEVRARSPAVLLTAATTEPHFGRFGASGCRTGCTEWPGVQALVWHLGRYCRPPAASVSLAHEGRGFLKALRQARYGFSGTENVLR